MAIEVGAIIEGKVSGITNFGAFVDLAEGKTGMVHISEVASVFVNDIHEHLTIGQTVKVKVLAISPEGKISLSIKKAEDAGERRPSGARRPAGPRPSGSRPSSPQTPGRPGHFEWQSSTRGESSDFEDMMTRFKAASDDRMGDMYRADGNRRGNRHGGQKQSIPDDE